MKKKALFLSLLLVGGCSSAMVVKTPRSELKNLKYEVGTDSTDSLRYETSLEQQKKEREQPDPYFESFYSKKKKRIRLKVKKNSA